LLELRESAMRLGLLRKYGGMLLATPRGREFRDDPLGLWWHPAEQAHPVRMMTRGDSHDLLSPGRHQAAEW
jgi:hypothetical protein